jgi:putative proteasome-type protease
MTFCVGIKVKRGLIALADTEITKGDERLNKSKMWMKGDQTGFWWIMTSGLRSIRDKALIYLEEHSAGQIHPYARLYEVANAFGQQLRRVREEDGASLAQSNLSFNLHAILGGKLPNDTEPTMFYIYPEGNWIEASQDSPYFVVGRTPYAKPILDRMLSIDLDLHQALVVAFLAFDATHASVTDVGFPIDIIMHDAQTGEVLQSRFEAMELQSAADWWQDHLVHSLSMFPTDYFKKLIGGHKENQGFASS